MSVKRNRMAGCALLLTVVLILTGATAEAELVEPDAPDGHIVKTLTIGGVEVSVDADVYGSDGKAVQAYRLSQRSFGSKPENEIALTAFLGDEPILTRRTMWTAEDVCFETDGARLDVSPWGVSLRRSEAVRFENLQAAFLLSSVAERLTIQELPGFSMEEAADRLGPMLDQLGIAAVKRPVDGTSLTLGELQEAAQARLSDGVLPGETVFTDYTEEDECYTLLLPYLYHGLMVMPTGEHLPYTNQYETPFANVNALISRRGVEKLELDFIPGEERADGEPFRPISVEEALSACEELPRPAAWENGLSPRIHEIRLGYVFLSRNLSTTEVDARPAWIMNVFGDDISLAETMGNGTCRDCIAIDAETGEMLLAW